MRLLLEYEREFKRNVRYLNRVYDNVFKFNQLMNFRNESGLRNRLSDFAFFPLVLSYYTVLTPLAVEAIPESLIRTIISK